MWNFKGYHWNSTQSTLPIHWKIQFLFTLKCSQIYSLACVFRTPLARRRFHFHFTFASVWVFRHCRTVARTDVWQYLNIFFISIPWAWLARVVFTASKIFRNVRSKKTSKLRITGHCEGNLPITGEFPSQRLVTRKMLPFDDVIIIIQEFEHSLAVIKTCDDMKLKKETLNIQ